MEHATVFPDRKSRTSLIPDDAQAALLRQHRLSADVRRAGGSGVDWYPLVKLFSDGKYRIVFLITEMAEDGDTVFGLYNFGFSLPAPATGPFSLAVLEAGWDGQTIFRDAGFHAGGRLSAYVGYASLVGRVEDDCWHRPNLLQRGSDRGSLFTEEQLYTLRKNSSRQAEARWKFDMADLVPVVKLVERKPGAAWLITEIDADSDTLFGLCDSGNGIPALDTVSAFVLSRGRDSGFLVERDDSFIARAPLSAYARAARKAGRIVEVS